MAGRKITQLPTLTEPAATDKLVIVDVSDTSESPQGTSKQIAFENLSSGITSIESGSLDVTIDGGVATVELPYKEYIGLINQTDDNPPVLTQQLNNTGLTFTPSYTSEGNYRIAFSSYPTLAKVNVNIMSTYGKANVGATYEAGVGIVVETYSILSNVDENSNLVNSSIHIKVFP